MKGIGIALVLLGSLVALGLGLLVAQSEGTAQGAVTFGVGGVIAYVGLETFNRARDRERGEKLRTDEAARRAAETEAGGSGSTEGRSDSQSHHTRGSAPGAPLSSDGTRTGRPGAVP